MARSRNIKPGFFKNEVLGEMDPNVRLLFIGIWTIADREGRLEYRPLRVKAEICPYDSYDIEEAIALLVDGGFLIPYEADGRQLMQVVNWLKHQQPHHKETASTFPPPPGHSNGVCDGYIPLNNSIRKRIYARDGRVCRTCGATHGLSIDHVIPVSKGGNSTDDNLQVLCMGCNFSKSNKIISTNHTQTIHESCMKHQQTMHGSKKTLLVPLIPDSLSSDSLNPLNVNNTVQQAGPVTESPPCALPDNTATPQRLRSAPPAPPAPPADTPLPPAPPSPRSAPSDVTALFDHWRVVMKTPGSQLTDERRRKITSVLRHYPLASLIKAVNGCAVTPHNMGENDRGERYDDICLIIRDSGHIERFMRNADSPPKFNGGNHGTHQHDDRSRAQKVRDKLVDIAQRDIAKNGFTDKLD